MNLSYRTGAAAAAALLFLGGCARATDYTGKPARMYVVGLTGMGWDNDFSLAFAAKFHEVAKQCGVESTYDELSGLELDPNAITARMRAFQADTLLTISNGGGVVSAYGQRLSIRYASTLTDVRLRRPVWKGQYNFSRGATAIPLEERAAVFAIDITNSLKHDGFLSGCAPIALGQNGRLDPASVPAIAHGAPIRPAAAGGAAPAPAPAGTQAAHAGAPMPGGPGGATLQDLQDLLPK
ncbi:hypothetical protein ACKI2N_030320 [Cupriavidus sp. 30B13]|uniref:hypothetical protein n=1 Tax=Cupriavidus sp. 30B13 TaxID=3384241 RepID=UPI003B90666B